MFVTLVTALEELVDKDDEGEFETVSRSSTEMVVLLLSEEESLLPGSLNTENGDLDAGSAESSSSSASNFLRRSFNSLFVNIGLSPHVSSTINVNS